MVFFSNALLSLSHLGVPVTHSSGLGTYINSLYDSDTKLYAFSTDGSGDIKATAIAFQCLDILNLLSSQEVVEKKDSIKQYLTKLKKSDNGQEYFSSIVYFFSTKF